MSIGDWKKHLQQHLAEPMQTKGTWINTMFANHYMSAETARSIASLV